MILSGLGGRTAAHGLGSAIAPACTLPSSSASGRTLSWPSSSPQWVGSAAVELQLPFITASKGNRKGRRARKWRACHHAKGFEPKWLRST